MLCSHPISWRAAAWCVVLMAAAAPAARAQQANLGNSQPRNFSPVVFHNSTLFAASDGSTGVELWRTDGITAARIADVNTGAPGSYPHQIARRFAFGEEAFVSARSAAGLGRELHFWNGTSAQLVLDINPGSLGSDPSELVVLPGGVAVFTAFDGSGRDLWLSNGTALGTLRVPLHAGYSEPYGLTLDGNRVFFCAWHPSFGTELWITTGTALSTRLVLDIEPGTASSAPSAFTVRNGELVFAASTSLAGREIWRSDGSANGTVLAVDVTAGAAGSDPDLLSTGFGHVAFTARDPSLGRELYRTNLTLTTRESSFAEGDTIAELRAGGLDFFFTVETPSNGRELWKLSSMGGLGLVSDLQLGAASSDPLWLLPIPISGLGFGMGCVFRADDGALGDELWLYNGTTTQLLADLRLPNSTPSFLCGSGSSRLARANAVPGTYVFAARADLGTELFATDLSAVVPLGDLKPLLAGTQAEPELHIYPEGNLLDVALTEAPPNAPAFLIVAALQTPFPLVFLFLNGALQVDLLGPQITLFLGATDASGRASVSIPLPLAPANIPLLLQAVVLDLAAPRPVVTSNTVSGTTYACEVGNVSAAVPSAKLQDDNGEYKITVWRTDSNPDSAYLGLVRVVRSTGELVLVEIHPLDPGAQLELEGQIDLYPPETDSDPKGDQLMLRLYEESPTQKTVADGCLLYISYC